MASDCGDGDYLGAYRRFFEDFVAQVDPDDQLPVKVSTYDLTEAEISGEIIDWTLQYLNQKYCPPSLQSYLVHHVMEEVKLLCSKQPESCGWRFQENTFAPLRLMHAVTNKVNEICLRYLDNSRLALLPPPPSTPIPLVSRCAIKNSRRKMEDRHVVIHDLHTIFSIQDDSPGNYYAVFDGHAGQDAAVYCAAHLHQYLAESIHYPTDPERALRDAFLTTDAHFIEKSNKQNLNSGTTAVCALLLNRKLYVAWVGDSQAVLAKRGQITQLVNPHKPDRDDERERVNDMGGAVIHWGIWRVNGQLAVSRAIGDVQYKPYVTGDPDIRCIPLDGTEDFLIVACDGLWDYVSEAMATTLVYQQLREDPRDLEAVSQRLVHFARSQGSTDNISTIVVFLTNPRQVAARHPTSHPLLADVQLNNMESTNPFLSNANNGIQFEVNPFGKQQQQQQSSNGTCAENEENVHYRDHFETPSNGKHANGAGFDNNGDNRGNNDEEDEDDDDDDDDLGPETDVDAVDEGLEGSVVPPTVDNLSRELFPEKLDEREGFRESGESSDDHPAPKDHLATLPCTEEADQHALIPDADNVADSEDSEDEWNYYPNKEKERITITGEGGERKDDKLTTSAKSTNEREIYEDPSEADKETEEPELIESEIIAETEPPKERNETELEDDMDFQLNPNAAEFVPVSPPKALSTRANLNEDFLLSGSPQKQTPEMDDITVPSQGEFQVEVSLRPHEMEQSNGQATKELHQTEFTDYLMDRQKSGNGTALGLDESEISSTKAEFGDESTTSFMTATDFQKTGISLVDDSFTGSEREDYDIAKDPMAMSFTPGDFQAAFEKEGDDLNVIHQLNESDLMGDDDAAGITEENLTAQSPDLHPELTTLVTPDSDHPPPTAAFPDGKHENLLELVSDDISTNENHSRPTSPEPLIKNETSLISGMVELIPSSCLLGTRSTNDDSTILDQASEETRYHALDTSSPLEGHMTPEEATHAFCTVSDKARPLLDHADIENIVSPIPSAAHETKPSSSPAPDTETVASEVASLLVDQLPSSPQPDSVILEAESTIGKTSATPDFATFATTTSEGQEGQAPLSPQPVNDANSQELAVDADVQHATARIDTLLNTPPTVSKDQFSPSEEVNSSPDEQFKLVLDQTELNDSPAGEEKREMLCEFESHVPGPETQLESPLEDKPSENSASSNVVFDMACPPFSTGNYSRNDAGIDEILQKEASSQFSSQLPNEESSVLGQPEKQGGENLVQTETDSELPKETMEPEEAISVSENIASAEKELKTLETLVNEEPLINTPVMNLSESMQEFTGLEEQLKPQDHTPLSNGVAEIADSKVESQDTAVEHLVDEKIVADVDAKPDKSEKTEKIEAIEQTEPKTEKLSVGTPLAAAAAVSVAAAATVAASGAAKTTKAKAGIKASPRTTTATTTTKTTNKSTPTSPTKAASATQRTTGTSSLAKKPTLGAASRPKNLETTKTTSLTSTTNKSPAAKTTAATPKPATTAKASTTRTSMLTVASKPKSTTTASRPSTATAAEKKPTTNGDAKPLSKTAAPKPAARSVTGSTTTATKTISKTSTAARPAPGATAAPLKPRPVSATTTLKPKVAATSATSTSVQPRPKSSPAPGSTASAAPKLRSTLTKSPVTDKQAKETTNKQLSSARTSGSTLTKSSGRTSTTGTTTMAKRSLAGKNPPPAAAQPQKKPAPITRPGGKLSSLKNAGKTTITASTTKTTEVEVVQNGVSEVRETKMVISSSTVEEDVPQKDVSPVTSSTDNQLIMTAD